MFRTASLVLVIMVLALSLSLAQEESTMPQEQTMAPALTVDQMAFCTSVENREPVGADTAFADTVGQVYCFTQISGAGDATDISHVWYLNGEEKASVNLSVQGKTWRTWSSKTIPKEWAGNWRVEVKSADGNVLMSKEFVVR
jgi:predicted lipid-binding transport protein (Tim44 family)